MNCCCHGSDYSPSSVDIDEEEEKKEDVLNLDTLETIATIFAFASSIIAFFMKFGSVIRMPDFFSSLITQVLSFFLRSLISTLKRLPY
jgi:hypothetical protein